MAGQAVSRLSDYRHRLSPAQQLPPAHPIRRNRQCHTELRPALQPETLRRLNRDTVAVGVQQGIVELDQQISAAAIVDPDLLDAGVERYFDAGCSDACGAGGVGEGANGFMVGGP